MDIGTAKPSPEDRSAIPHHLIDIADPTESYTAGRFVRDAEESIEEVLAAGGRPIVVGGSGLYISALVDGLHEAPGANPELRSLDKETLLARLPDSERQRLLNAPSQRITRAVEIVEGGGRGERRPPRFEFQLFRIMIDRAELHRRINLRVDRMIEAGLVDEVRRLRTRGVTRDMTSQKAIGYREVHQFLDGEIDEAEMVRLIKRNTRRYAKRQETWFRNQFGERCATIGDEIS